MKWLSVEVTVVDKDARILCVNNNGERVRAKITPKAMGFLTMLRSQGVTHYDVCFNAGDGQQLVIGKITAAKVLQNMFGEVEVPEVKAASPKHDTTAVLAKLGELLQADDEE